jgi:hypothetical protein
VDHYGGLIWRSLGYFIPFPSHIFRYIIAAQPFIHNREPGAGYADGAEGVRTVAMQGLSAFAVGGKVKDAFHFTERERKCVLLHYEM